MTLIIKPMGYTDGVYGAMTVYCPMCKGDTKSIGYRRGIEPPLAEVWQCSNCGIHFTIIEYLKPKEE